MIFIQQAPNAIPYHCAAVPLPYISGRTNKRTRMKSYFTFLRRNKLYTSIQFFGLATALGLVIILASYAATEFNIGGATPASKELYAVGYGEGLGMTVGTADEFFPSVPEIKEWTRVLDIDSEGMDLTVDGEYFTGHCLGVDSNFFRMLGYTLVGHDSGNVLASADEAIISERFANEVFGNDNPIGRTIMYGGKTPLHVVGIMPESGPEELLKPVDLFVSFELEEGSYSRMDNFGSTNIFVKLAEGACPDSVANTLLGKYQDYWEYWGTENGFLWGSNLTRMDKIYFSPLNAEWGPFRKGSRSQVHVLLALALVLLLSAMFNYINLTVSQTGKRAHEMATRRLMGDFPSQIVLRYLSESAVFTTICFIGGYMAAIFSKPYFERLLSTQITLSPSLKTTVFALLSLGAIAVISGLVPALVIRKYSPIDIAKGNFRLYDKQFLSRLFIIAQNIISTVLITLGLTMASQIRHLATLPLGYDTNLAFVNSWELGPSLDKQAILQERLRALPEVSEVALARKLPFRSGHDGVHSEDGKLSWLHLSDVDSSAFKMLGFKVSEQWSDPLPGMIWVTEETRDRYRISADNPRFGLDGNSGGYRYEVCGVVSDFRSLMPLDAPLPDSHEAIAVTDPAGYIIYQVIKTNGDRTKALEEIRRVCREVSSEMTGLPKSLEANYIDNHLEEDLSDERNTLALVLCFMAISILISALGMLAIAIGYTERQSKRIALCKVMGAETRDAAWQLSRQFLFLSLLAACVSIPICHEAARFSLESFYNRIDFPWHLIAAAVMATVGIAFVSVIWQTLKVARRNPIDSIRTE